MNAAPKFYCVNLVIVTRWQFIRDHLALPRDKEEYWIIYSWQFWILKLRNKINRNSFKAFDQKSKHWSSKQDHPCQLKSKTKTKKYELSSSLLYITSDGLLIIVQYLMPITNNNPVSWLDSHDTAVWHYLGKEKQYFINFHFV